MNREEALATIRRLELPSQVSATHAPKRYVMSRRQVRAAVEQAERAHCVSVARTGGSVTYAAVLEASLVARFGRPAKKAV